ncbi:MAG: dihydroneopterin aldolase [Rhodobiaceae bacterium]|jgi:dihydroneopterin aldolase|nr:dihydroneopterin aldolase [Rhodobiaceae bacterium]OUT93841.1 MAG: dihydroneopterin aldolase [Rhizobiales bacterium TMED29]
MNQQNFADISTMASATRGLRRVFIRDLVLPARIGIHDHERAQAQPVIINVDASVEEAVEGADTTTTGTIADVVCYETLTKQIKEVLAGGHTDLVEVLAEEIADRLLADARIIRLRIRLEKPEAIAEAAGVGVEIERLSRRDPAISQAETT